MLSNSKLGGIKLLLSTHFYHRFWRGFLALLTSFYFLGFYFFEFFKIRNNVWERVLSDK